jgi:hypothetical protein
MNVFVAGCGKWRLDVCQVSLKRIHDDGNGIFVKIVEEIVVEVVGVVGLTDHGW